MSKPLPPEHVRQVKTALRRADKAARAARLEWTTLRDIHKAGVTPGGIVQATLRMWNTEADLEAAAAAWRLILAEHESMPVAERWDLAALERWAAAQDKAGAP